MAELNEDWCKQNPIAAAREIEKLNVRIRELEEVLGRLRSGKDVVLPQSREHAIYMQAISEAFLEQIA